MNDTASVTSSSLAVAEKTPRRNGGCVGIFFQLFDWNRRFTKKKKLFSKRLLPPDRAKEASKKFGGDDKPPKLRLIADENSRGFPNKNKNGVNGVQTPSLIARLMGLESMPSEKLPKDDSGEFTVGRREKMVGDSGEFRPQKLQKTGMADRRSVTRFGAEALQLKHVLSQSRKHHHPKLASPVKNASHQPKRNTSRLIGAAARILEPGLQARNKSRYGITYGPGASRPLRNGLRSEPVKGEDLDLVTGQASCRNCGTLIDIAKSTSKRDMINDSRYDQEPEFSTNGKAVDRSQWRLTNQQSLSMDQLNRGLSGRTRSRVRAKSEDMKFDKHEKFESARVNGASPRPKRQVTHARRQRESYGVVSSSINRLVWQPDYLGQIGNKNRDEGMAFRFNSPMKNNTNGSVCKLTSRKRFTPNPSGEKIGVQKRFPSTVAGYESGISGNLPNDRNRLPRHHSFRHNQCTSFSLQPIIGGKNSDHLSPGSVLEASFSNDSCCSSSLEDSSVRTQHADSMSYSYDDESQFQESETDPFDSGEPLRKENHHNKLVADLLNYISLTLCSLDLVNSRMKGSIKKVIFNSELVLSNQMPHNPNEINSFFICDLLLELNALADAMQACFGNFLGPQNSNSRYQLKRFAFDSLIEYLESKYMRYSKCGFRAWMSLPRFMGFDHLIHEVVGEVRRWMGANSVELQVEMDTSHGSEKWTDFEIEAYETGAQVECDIIQMLIDELVVDVSTRIGDFRV